MLDSHREPEASAFCYFKADIEYSTWYAVTHTAARASIKQQQREPEEGLRNSVGKVPQKAWRMTTNTLSVRASSRHMHLRCAFTWHDKSVHCDIGLLCYQMLTASLLTSTTLYEQSSEHTYFLMYH